MMIIHCWFWQWQARSTRRQPKKLVGFGWLYFGKCHLYWISSSNILCHHRKCPTVRFVISCKLHLHIMEDLRHAQNLILAYIGQNHMFHNRLRMFPWNLLDIILNMENSGSVGKHSHHHKRQIAKPNEMLVTFWVPSLSAAVAFSVQCIYYQRALWLSINTSILHIRTLTSQVSVTSKDKS